MKIPIIILCMCTLVLALFLSTGPVYTQQKSDLPAGWDEPAQLPPGAVKLEDLKSTYGDVPTHTTTSGGIPPPAPEAQPSSPPPQTPPATTTTTTPPAPRPPSRWSSDEPAATAPAATTQPTPAGAPTTPPPPVAGEPVPSEAIGVNDTRSEPVDWGKAPPEARKGKGALPPAAAQKPAYVPPPDMTPAAPLPSAPPPPPIPQPVYSGAKSDLPADWGNEHPQLPQGGVRLEDVRSPYGAPPSARSAPTTGPTLPQMATPPQADEEEIIGGEKGAEEARPPSRWDK